MIKIIPIQQAYQAKIERQSKLPGLKFKCHGSCAYLGADISPGCFGCFHSAAEHFSFMLGRDFRLLNVCNRDCDYCFELHHVGRSPPAGPDWRLSEQWKEGLKRQAAESRNRPGSPMAYYEFSGACEPLLYLPVVSELMTFFRAEIDPLLGVRGWAKLYTNGTLLNRENLRALAALGLDELRVHPGASDFSAGIYRKVESAVKILPTITVETPLWPRHEAKLREMLPILQEIGVKHLNLCQVEIMSQPQLKRIEKALGEVTLYQAFYPVLEDGGLAEELMAEHQSRGYAFSVLDCNGFVKQSRAALSEDSFWNVLNREYPPEWRDFWLRRQANSA